MKMHPVAACLVLVLAAGCASDRAEMYARGNGGSAPKGGIVRYVNHGSEELLKARRADAKSSMAAYCRGSFNVVTEGPYRVLDAGAKVIPIGEGGTAAQDSEEDYWLVVFQCQAASAQAQAEASSRAPEAPEPAPVALDRAALKGLSVGEVYQRLVPAEQAQVADFLKGLSSREKDKLTDYILKNKGSTAFLSWEFRASPDLPAAERRFVNWYLRGNTDYKPVF